MDFTSVGIVLCAVVTAIFLLCLKRLWKLRYTQKIFVHSFNQLLLVYTIMYLECILGINVAMFIIPIDPHLNNKSCFFIFYFLIILSSSSFILRILRIYRIFLSTYIEKALLNYDKLIKRKYRLTQRWNLIMFFGYLIIIVLTFSILFILHKQLSNSNLLDFMEFCLLIYKSLELSLEVFTSLVFLMKKTIKNVYKLECIVIICHQAVCLYFLASNNILEFLKYGIISIIKIISLLFMDFFITTLLIKENEKKPLLPPVYLINSSVFVTEIELVYNSFNEFIDKRGNKKWKSLLEALMQIQIRKMNKKVKKSRSFVEKLGKIEESLIKSFNIANFEDFNETLQFYEIEIIKELDEEAFPQYMASDHYKMLSEDMINYNNNIIDSQ